MGSVSILTDMSPKEVPDPIFLGGMSRKRQHDTAGVSRCLPTSDLESLAPFLCFQCLDNALIGPAKRQ